MRILFVRTFSGKALRLDTPEQNLDARHFGHRACPRRAEWRTIQLRTGAVSLAGSRFLPR